MGKERLLEAWKPSFLWSVFLNALTMWFAFLSKKKKEEKKVNKG